MLRLPNPLARGISPGHSGWMYWLTGTEISTWHWQLAAAAAVAVTGAGLLWYAMRKK